MPVATQARCGGSETVTNIEEMVVKIAPHGVRTLSSLVFAASLPVVALEAQTDEA